MPGPYIPNPVPWWMRPENASVLDSLPKKVARKIATLAGLTDPQNQILAMMTPMIPEGQATVSAPLKAIGGKLSELAEKVGIKAYHGSPHDFDQFSLSKIGTGEGAQAYGHGLYFAENPAVAKDYARQLSSPVPSRIYVDGKELTFGEAAEQAFGKESAAAIQNVSGIQNNGDAWDGLAATLSEKGHTVELPRGRTYEVQLHASPDQFLDWDKPLSEQSEHVRRALGPDLQREEFVAAAGKRLVDYSGDTLLGVKLQTELRKNGGDVEQALNTLAGMGNERWKQAVERARSLDWSGLRTEAVERPGTGANLISDLQQQHTPAGVNEYLKAKGIPGIRYLDAGSRGGNRDAWLVTSPSGMVRQFTNEAEAKAAHAQIGGSLTPPTASRNYVIFDENLVSILKKYGVALPLIEGLRERAKQNGGVISRQDVDALQ